MSLSSTKIWQSNPPSCSSRGNEAQTLGVSDVFEEISASLPRLLQFSDTLLIFSDNVSICLNCTANSFVRPLGSNGIMKKLLSSPDFIQLQLFAKRLLGAGIPCEIRAGNLRGRSSPCAQLWIRNDIDNRRAAILFGGFTGGQSPEVLFDRS